jgi:hypothetical protein
MADEVANAVSNTVTIHESVVEAVLDPRWFQL